MYVLQSLGANGKRGSFSKAGNKVQYFLRDNTS